MRVGKVAILDMLVLNSSGGRACREQSRRGDCVELHCEEWVEGRVKYSIIIPSKVRQSLVENGFVKNKRRSSVNSGVEILTKVPKIKGDG